MGIFNVLLLKRGNLCYNVGVVMSRFVIKRTDPNSLGYGDAC